MTDNAKKKGLTKKQTENKQNTQNSSTPIPLSLQDIQRVNDGIQHIAPASEEAVYDQTEKLGLVRKRKTNIDISLGKIEIKDNFEKDVLDEESSKRKKKLKRPLHMQFSFWVWFLAIFFILLTICLMIVNAYNRPKHFSKNVTKPRSKSLSTPVSVSNSLQKLESLLIKPPLHIHMLWTTEAYTFKPRNFKVIDAYLFHHPDAEIIVYASHLPISFFQKYSNAGYNVRVVRLDDQFLNNLSIDCPGKEWIQNIAEWKQGKYYYTHITDYVRFCALYKMGGLYSDFDAITLQRLDEHENFIGKDNALTNGGCDWCAWQNDIYLPPGVMAVTKGHHLMKKALEIGFGGTYDPKVFNSVGPMAITKAYTVLAAKFGIDVIKVYEQHRLYPYNFKTSEIVFEKTLDSNGKLNRIRALSSSLHLFGHQTRFMDIHPQSIVQKAFNLYSIVSCGSDMFTLKAPSHLAIGNIVEEVKDIRVCSPEKFNWKTKFGLTITADFGKIKFADEIGNGWTKFIVISEKTPAQINRKLSRVLYNADFGAANGRDQLTIKFSFINDKRQLVEQTLRIPVYEISKLVTIIVKTVGRMDKVISLVESTRLYYKTVKIIVSDDHDKLYKQVEGMCREFYYLPLSYDIGLSAGRNKMVQRVTTEYFLTLDDDFTMDSTSQIGILIHALETKPKDGSQRFDIAAGKDPVGEEKFKLDFCGFMTINNKTLFLNEGVYGQHSGCKHVDFVPNIFLGRTEIFKKKIKWDELLKVGEHEDFFLRAKRLGIKTLTCPSVSFMHAQVDHWLKRDAYEVKRSRIYDFWRLSLRKHGLEKLNSFGKVMMDLIAPQPISLIEINEILSNSLQLCWSSQSPNHKIMFTEADRLDWRPVNGGQGVDYYGGNCVSVANLVAGRSYKFRVFAGNFFEFEQTGKIVEGVTISKKMENEMNLIKNGIFQNGFSHFQSSLGGRLELTNDSREGRFSGQLQIVTRSYLSSTPTQNFISQTVKYSPNNKKVGILSKSSKNMHSNDLSAPDKRHIIATVYSKVERFFGGPIDWAMELRVWFKGDDVNQFVYSRETFDVAETGWQLRAMRVCLRVGAKVDRIEVRGVLIAFRGYVNFDNFLVVDIVS